MHALFALGMSMCEILFDMVAFGMANSIRRNIIRVGVCDPNGKLHGASRQMEDHSVGREAVSPERCCVVVRLWSCPVVSDPIVCQIAH